MDTSSNHRGASNAVDMDTNAAAVAVVIIGQDLPGYRDTQLSLERQLLSPGRVLPVPSEARSSKESLIAKIQGLLKNTSYESRVSYVTLCEAGTIFPPDYFHHIHLLLQHESKPSVIFTDVEVSKTVQRLGTRARSEVIFTLNEPNSLPSLLAFPGAAISGFVFDSSLLNREADEWYQVGGTVGLAWYLSQREPVKNSATSPLNTEFMVQASSGLRPLCCHSLEDRERLAARLQQEAHLQAFDGISNALKKFAVMTGVSWPGEHESLDIWHGPGLPADELLQAGQRFSQRIVPAQPVLTKLRFSMLTTASNLKLKILCTVCDAASGALVQCGELMVGEGELSPYLLDPNVRRASVEWKLTPIAGCERRPLDLVLEVVSMSVPDGSPVRFEVVDDFGDELGPLLPVGSSADPSTPQRYALAVATTGTQSRDGLSCYVPLQDGSSDATELRSLSQARLKPKASLEARYWENEVSTYRQLLTKVNARLAEMEIDLVAYQREVATRDARVAALQHQLQMREHELASMQGELDKVTRQLGRALNDSVLLAQVVQSKGWRYISTLRNLKNRFLPSFGR